MNKLTPIEIAKKKMAMRIRAAARLQVSEAYLDLIQETLPEAEIEFEKNIQQGKLPKPLDLKKALRG